MTTQYLRRVSVKVASARRAWDFGDFRCKFTVRRGDMQTPNSCDVRIYNTSQNVEDTLSPTTSEFTTLEVATGYGPPIDPDADLNLDNGPPDPGNVARIFSGTICQVRVGRESQVDSYIDVTATDGDHAYNFATVSASLAAANPGSIAEFLVNALKPSGIQPTPTPDFSQPQFVGTPLPVTRGRTFYGAVKDELRQFVENNDLQWSIQDSTLKLISMTTLAPTAAATAIVVGPGTGLIGSPEQTPNGVVMKMLLNPTIKVCSLVKIDASVNRYAFPLDYTSSAANLITAGQNKISDSGLYYVMSVEHNGDTRGQEWYTTATCLSIDARLANVDLTGALHVGPRATPIPDVTR